MELKSYAKLNLGLRVHGRRPDGFHLLSTVFQTISLHDTIRFEEHDELILECDSPDVPADDGNLIIKAAEILRAHSGSRAGAKITLEKRIPSPGGLGGGSSNAAIALLGLSKMWGLSLAPKEMLRVASGLGADVPFFLYGGTAKGCNRGDEIISMDDADIGKVLVLTPDFGIQTALAFSALQRPGLTSSEAESILRVCRSDSGKSLVSMANDFESWAFESHPELRSMAEELTRRGATSVSLSGSGSSIFALFEKEETRQATLEALADSPWRKFAVATVTRAEYRDALSECQGLFPISF